MRRSAAVVFGAIACITFVPTYAASWTPQKNVEIVVGTAPGGGTDGTARVIQKLLQDPLAVPFVPVVLNKPGAGGAIAYSYAIQRAGDPNCIVVSPPQLITSYITGVSSVRYTDVTPIAFLASEYVAFAVKAESKIRNAGDLVAALKNDPSALSIGIGSVVGNTNHISIAQLLNRAGVDVSKLVIVSFRSPAETTTALLGGHIDAVALAASNLVQHANNPRLRLIAIAAPARISGALTVVPTLREQGFDVVTRQWRAIVGPKGLKPEYVAYWESIFARLSQTEQWQAYLESVAYKSTYLNHTDTEKFFAEEDREMTAVLRVLGMAKR